MEIPKTKKKKISKTQENRINNIELFEFFSAKGINTCELNLEGCEGSWCLQIAHSKKRNKMASKGQERITDLKEVCLSCGNCHILIEYPKPEVLENGETGHQYMARKVREAIERRE